MHNLFTGHKAFLGFFYLDYAYNNAVVHVFIQILKESVCKDLSKPMIQDPYEQKDNKMNIYSLTSGKPHCLSESVAKTLLITMISMDGQDISMS